VTVWLLFVVGSEEIQRSQLSERSGRRNGMLVSFLREISGRQNEGSKTGWTGSGCRSAR
jgi:hypothetical protein